ncbi:MAG: hypothetical protein NTZ16_15000 [Verrucomicrobia bacterium]|nr:hypothetical protein [Verrucomicrobiota bacterium]
MVSGGLLPTRRYDALPLPDAENPGYWQIFPVSAAFFGGWLAANDQNDSRLPVWLAANARFDRRFAVWLWSGR